MNLGNVLIVLAGLIWAIELVPQIHRTVRKKVLMTYL